GIACVVTGEFAEAERSFETVLEATRADLAREHFSPVAFPRAVDLDRALAVLSRAWLVWLLAERGAFAEGIALGEEALRMAEALDHPYSLLRACLHLGELHAGKADFEQAIPLID